MIEPGQVYELTYSNEETRYVLVLREDTWPCYRCLILDTGRESTFGDRALWFATRIA